MKDLLSVLRWVQNPRSRLAGFRVAQLVPGIGPAAARRLLDAMDRAADPVQAMRAFKPPTAAATDWQRLAADARGAGRAAPGPTTWPSRRAGTSHTWSACTTTHRCARPTWRNSHASPRAAPSRERFLDRADARPARGDQRRIRCAAPRRGLPDPVDDALGQGPGMDRGVRAQRRSTAACRRTWPPAARPRSRRSGACSTWR